MARSKKAAASSKPGKPRNIRNLEFADKAFETIQRWHRQTKIPQKVIASRIIEEFAERPEEEQRAFMLRLTNLDDKANGEND